MVREPNRLQQNIVILLPNEDADFLAADYFLQNLQRGLEPFLELQVDAQVLEHAEDRHDEIRRGQHSLEDLPARRDFMA